MRVTTRLRQLLAGPELIVAPGAYDALSARLIAQAGFPVVYMTGFGTAASVLGQPDVGLLTMSEIVSRAGRRRRRGAPHCGCRYRIWQSH